MSTSTMGHALTRASRLWALLSWWRLARGVSRRDRAPWLILIGSFALYFVIGQSIQIFSGHDAWNLFFNADPPRVVSDLTDAHVRRPSINASSAHPLVVLLLNPVGALLTRLFGGSRVLAALTLSHAAGALGNVFTYLAIRRLGLARPTAVLGALALALSTTQLVLASIPETGSFTCAAAALTLWLTLRGGSLLGPALAGAVTLGLNGAMLPHALLAAPVLWAGQRRPRWVLTVVAYWLVLAAVFAAAYALQREHYPGISLFGKSGYSEYQGYVSVPTTGAAFVSRAKLVAWHLLAFAFVAPRPLFTDPPDKITTFFWTQKNLLAHYDPIGSATLLLWAALLAIAGMENTRRLATSDTTHRGFVALTVGWLLGCAGLFMVFGDDVLLFSYFWAAHVVLFVAVGVGHARARGGAWPRAIRILVGLFVLALLANQGTFLVRMLSHYSTSVWLI